MPRIRDFNGISDKGFDGRGNYTVGIKEQIAFPEISIDKISNITGMDITFVTNTDVNAEALELLKELGLPFKKNDAAEKAREEEIEKAREEERREAEEQAKLEASGEENTDSDEANSKEEINTVSNSTDNIDTETNNNTTDIQESETKGNNQDLSEDSDNLES